MPTQFRYLEDPLIKRFVSELCDAKTISSFARRVKDARKYDSELQELLSWHYIELLLAATLGRPEVRNLYRRLSEAEFRNCFFETSEFLTICSGVYGEMQDKSRRSFRAKFNGMFNDPQALSRFHTRCSQRNA
jgi:hypothetical protein